MIKIRNQNGFTIVEMLIYMGLLSIFLILLTGILADILDVQKDSQSASAVEQNTRYITARLAYDINRATSITTPTLGSTGTSLVLVINGSNNTYAQNSNNLQITNSLGTNNLNTSEVTVTNLSFQRVGNTTTSKNTTPKSSVKVSFTITSTTRGKTGYDVKNVSTTIGIR